MMRGELLFVHLTEDRCLMIDSLGLPAKQAGRQAIFQKTNNEPARGAFAPYAFDAWLVLLDSAKRALATGAKPGTPEFRIALRDALVSTKDVIGTHGIYNFHAGSSFGVDKRALVLVKLVDSKWKLLQ
jgi:branched-chain amino acid transport system substrate-binding protein